MRYYLFQYRSHSKDLMVSIQAESLNAALIKFATHYHDIEEVYEVAEDTVLNNKLFQA